MPTHTRPTTLRIHPTIRRSCARQSLPLRRQGDLVPRKRGSPLLARGLGDVPPVIKKPPGRGRAGEARAAVPPGGWAQPTSQCRPNPPPAAARCACRACPALFPFVHFGPSFTEALGLRSARALADTTCSPLSTFPTPSNRSGQPPSRPYLGDRVRLPLSTCPARLNPKLHRVSPGSGCRKNAFRQFNANRLHATPPLLAPPHDALPHHSPAIIAFLAHHKDPQPRRWDR